MRKQEEINRATAILRKKSDRISVAQAEVLEQRRTETQLFKEFVVSATGMTGADSSNTITTRRVMKNFYLCGDAVSEPSYGNGLMAPRVAIF